ncbi:hypothetical protein RvY_00039-3 [Ramazzottius varieornatus]|uniref:Piwi domain-containing protein n=1 Tax=Ramazzottius varieornatus TaxID=947166 RepID=A0A1D1UB95_RAMVA|nr:hypothetical protein RvY_00039-3 [Ramazzottius varieornatus]
MLKAFTQEVTMVLGADVTHPGFGEDVGKPSVAAVVASTNETYTEYVAEVRAQHKKVQESTSLKKKSKTQEIITDLGDMVLDLLEKFYTVNNKALPTLIIFYRDGVSEGQYKEVMKMEVEAIREACFEAYADKPIPPITYIIVGKRHHIRLFATNPADQAGRAKNVPTGTIADVKITHFSEFDYYLCSHGGIQGTSHPAHYDVLHDDSTLTSDQIQLFSFYLIFLYARCNRIVGIPCYWLEACAS